MKDSKNDWVDLTMLIESGQIIETEEDYLCMNCHNETNLLDVLAHGYLCSKQCKGQFLDEVTRLTNNNREDSRMDIRKFHDEKVMELPKDILIKGVELLTREFDEVLKIDVLRLYEKYGDNWMADHHLFWGMNIRNLLRTNGLNDNSLPSRNWDDYYMPIIELAVGIRIMDESKGYPIDESLREATP